MCHGCKDEPAQNLLKTSQFRPTFDILRSHFLVLPALCRRTCQRIAAQRRSCRKWCHLACGRDTVVRLYHRMTGFEELGQKGYGGTQSNFCHAQTAIFPSLPLSGLFLHLLPSSSPVRLPYGSSFLNASFSWAFPHPSHWPLCSSLHVLAISKSGAHSYPLTNCSQVKEVGIGLTMSL